MVSSALDQQQQQAPWPTKVLVSTYEQYVASNQNNDEVGQFLLQQTQDSGAAAFASTPDEDVLVEWFGSAFDNTSRQQQWCTCSEAISSSCHQSMMIDDKPVWWLLLRWCKMMLFKIARSYNAKPVLLMMMPLVVGILVGYCLGTRRTNTKPTGRMISTSLRRAWDVLAGLSLWVFLFVTTQGGSLFLSTVRSDDLTSTTARSSAPATRDASTSTSTSTLVCPKIPPGVASSTSDGVTAATKQPAAIDPLLVQREDNVRSNLRSDDGMRCESGVDAAKVPKHIAVIMDGNRRYGKEKYGSASRGHWDGSAKLVEFAKWCIAENVSYLTVYAFSTENWNRDPAEVAALMKIFIRYCDELRIEALQRNIKICVLSTDTVRIPQAVKQGLKQMVDETAHCEGGLTLNICMSYGSRGEIVNAARSVATNVMQGNLDVSSIDEDCIQGHLLTAQRGGDPDILIRTSGELRISNFLLWQLAYAEFFFIDKAWPAIEKEDLVEVIRSFANGRKRRFGK